MANVRNSNTFYIDTQYSGAADELAVKNIRVSAIFLTATGANAVLVLSDSGGNKKLDLRLATSGTSSSHIFYEQAMVFPNGIRPLTLTNAVATLIVEESRG